MNASFGRLCFIATSLCLVWLFQPTRAHAQAPLPTPPKTYTISAPLVEELFQRLSTAGIVTMLQNEVQHQPQPVTCPPSSEPAK